MNILLICPPATLNLPRPCQGYTFLQFFQSNLLKPYARQTVVGEHMGLEYLAACLEAAGHMVTLLDACLQQYPDWQRVVDELKREAESAFGLVGFTGSQDVFLENVAIAEALRAAGWTAHFTAGQDFCSLNHLELMEKFPVFDSIGRGEGDELIVELANTLERGATLESIQGLTYRQDGKVHANRPRRLIPDLDRIPFPDRRNWPYARRAGLAMGMVSSRGCGYNRCTFCYPNVFTSANKSLPGGPWRARSAINVVDELELVVQSHQPAQITFVDENFLGCGEQGVHRAYQFADEIKRRKLKVSYMINCRSVDIQIDLFRHLQESGLSSVFVGFESGAQKILDYYQKGATVAQQERALQVIQELGLGLVVGYIFFDPVSNLTDLRQSLDFYLRLGQYDTSKFSQRLRVLPGTTLYKRMKASGEVTGDIWRTRYDFSCPEIETVYVLVSGLFTAILPALLARVARKAPPTEAQAEQVIRLMEDYYYKALDLAQNGLVAGDGEAQATSHEWQNKIEACLEMG